MGGTGVTRDDLVMDAKETAPFFGPHAQEVIIQEKVDGANLGIWLTADYQLVTQNRSHTVNDKTASQWQGLGAWLTTHRAELLSILEPERHVLFGEWCKAQHSVAYNELPDYFLAFDIYDRGAGGDGEGEAKAAAATCKKKKSHPKKGKKHGGGEKGVSTLPGSFLSWSALQEKLSATTIKTVPVLGRQVFGSRQEIEAFLDSDSHFRSAGHLEGVYLRIEDEISQRVVRRGKVVRADFIQGISTHWIKMEMRKNTIKWG